MPAQRRGASAAPAHLSACAARVFAVLPLLAWRRLPLWAGGGGLPSRAPALLPRCGPTCAFSFLARCRAPRDAGRQAALLHACSLPCHHLYLNSASPTVSGDAATSVSFASSFLYFWARNDDVRPCTYLPCTLLPLAQARAWTAPSTAPAGASLLHKRGNLRRVGSTGGGARRRGRAAVAQRTLLRAHDSAPLRAGGCCARGAGFARLPTPLDAWRGAARLPHCAHLHLSSSNHATYFFALLAAVSCCRDSATA